MVRFSVLRLMGECYGVAGVFAGDQALEMVGAIDGLTIYGEDDVAFFQFGFFGWGIGPDFGDEYALGAVKAKWPLAVPASTEPSPMPI